MKFLHISVFASLAACSQSSKVYGKVKLHQNQAPWADQGEKVIKQWSSGSDGVLASTLGSAEAKISKEACHPKCSWTCGAAECDEVCEASCAPPVCQVSCRPVVAAQCTTKCEDPKCAVICPEKYVDAAPKCKTVCNPPRCQTQCSQECMTTCADPICAYDCKPNGKCAKPQCALTCGAAKGSGCKTTAFGSLQSQKSGFDTSAGASGGGLGVNVGVSDGGSFGDSGGPVPPGMPLFGQNEKNKKDPGVPYPVQDMPITPAGAVPISRGTASMEKDDFASAPLKAEAEKPAASDAKVEKAEDEKAK